MRALFKVSGYGHGDVTKARHHSCLYNLQNHEHGRTRTRCLDLSIHSWILEIGVEDLPS